MGVADPIVATIPGQGGGEGGGWPHPKKIFFVDSRSKLTRGGYDPWELFDPWVKNILTPGWKNFAAALRAAEKFFPILPWGGKAAEKFLGYPPTIPP